MTEEALNVQGKVGDVIPYQSNWDHLLDELRRVDLLLHRSILGKRRSRCSDHLGQLRGLVLSDEEIDMIFSNGTETEESPSGNGPAIHELDESLREIEMSMAARRAASLKQGVYLALDRLVSLFHLSLFEEQCLIICLAPEIDRKYEKLYAYVQDDVTRKKPTVDLLFSLLCETTEERLAARSVLDIRAPLLKYRLVHMGDDGAQSPVPLLSRTLKLDDRITDFLLGLDRIDRRTDSATHLISPRIGLDQVPLDDRQRNQIRTFVRSHFAGERSTQHRMVLYFHGPYGAGKRRVAEGLCGDLRLPLVMCDLKRAFDKEVSLDDLVWFSSREALLQQGALCFENFGDLLEENSNAKRRAELLFDAVETFSSLTFLLGDRPWYPHGLVKDSLSFNALQFSIPDALTRKDLWQAGLNGDYRVAEAVDPGVLASKFRFTAGQISDSLLMAKNLARWRSPGNDAVTAADLYAACRAQSNHKLGLLARKVHSHYTWKDLVLPPDQTQQLREICTQARLRHVVYDMWGFDRKLSLGKGLNVLFTGPPGTGKTMAAEVIAEDLQLELYKVDLSQVVSKYIGETEKNLDRIFAEAQSSNAILFFDEADALFGKRSEVKDAHDRYANIEIGYLLQKMEEYDGIAILATNLRQNMDEAFVRRIQSVVEFPFPDEKLREQIWIKIFPAQAPLSKDIDYAFLSRSFRIAGGNIKNVALTAAFYAAEKGSEIAMEHLVVALKRELQKMGKLCVESDFGPYYSVIQEGALV